MTDPDPKRYSEASRPTALVRAAVEALVTQFFEPLSIGELLRDAWLGAAASLFHAGASSVPPAPEYPANLAAAALDEVLARRKDVHTILCPRGRFWAPEPDPTSPAGWASRTFGIVLTERPPLTIADVVPQGPAQRAMDPPIPPDGHLIGSQTRITSEAVAETDQSPTELEAQFARQLQAAGWHRLQGGVDGPMAWSTWRPARDGEWQGLLFVLEGPGQRRRGLYARLDFPKQSGSGWTTGGMSISSFAASASSASAPSVSGVSGAGASLTRVAPPSPTAPPTPTPAR